ncbi:MAG: MFS transporter [Oscillospiraceae bacterium]|nr:MFS transporter [Oscillibacter sp.]MBQ3548255.1 MFS transporter [Oscillospiraceae bacterium]
MHNLARKIDWHHLAMQGSLFIGVGAVWSYGAVLMLSRGLSNSALGLITCIAQLLPMVLQPLTTRLCEKVAAMTPRRMILLLCAASLVVLSATFAFSRSLWLVIFCFIWVAVAANLMIPLVNIIMVEYMLRGVDINYGFGRSAGSLGYASASAALGFLLEGRDAILIVPVMALSMALHLVATFTFRYPLPGEEQEEKGAEEREADHRGFLRSRRDFLLMLLGLSLLLGVHNVTNVYMVHVVRRIGGGETLLGLVIGLSSGLEVVGMPFCSRLRRKWGIGGVMRLSALAFIVRMVLLLIAPNAAVLFLAALLQVLQCGLMLPAVVYYVADTLPLHQQTAGQSLMHLYNNCLAPALLSLMVGVVVDHGGINTALGAMLGLIVLGVVLVFAASRKKGA